MNYNTLIDYAPLLSLVVVPLIAWGGWVTKRIFVDNGNREACIKRIEGILERLEQKIDDFIKYNHDK